MTGLEFKKIRQALGLTQEELADMMGTWQTDISRTERRGPTKKDAATLTMIKNNMEEKANAKDKD